MMKNETKIENDADMGNAHEGFKDIVDLCYKKNLNRVIPNSAISHATYLLYKLLKSVVKHKRNHVRIISGRLDKRVYNQLVEVLQECQNAGVKMEVVVLEGVDDPNGGNKFYTSLLGYDKARCYEPTNANKKAIAGGTPHMLMVGNHGFRYETDTKTHRARANFHNPNFVEMLNTYFDRLVDRLLESNAISLSTRRNDGTAISHSETAA